MSTRAKTPRVVAYARVSIDAAGDQLAVSRQLEDCQRIAEARGWTIAQTYVDNSISAFKAEKTRPAYDQLVTDYAAGLFDTLLCYDLDRLTRQPRQLEDWIDSAERRGLVLVTANGEADLSTDGGRMYARIKAAVARAEMERKSARQKAAARQGAAMGKPGWTSRPFGWEKDGTLREAEAEVVRTLYREFQAGVPLGESARRLNMKGITTARGKAWGGVGVRQTLLRASNAGLREYGGKIVGKGNWEPIIDEPTYHAVRRALQGRTHAAGRPPSLLTGLAGCGNCNGKMKVLARERRGKHTTVYVCRECFGVSGSKDYVDSLVKLNLFLLLPLYRFAWKPTEASAMTGQRAGIERDIANLEDRKLGLTEAYADGLVTLAQLTTGTERIDAQLAQFADQLTALEQEDSPASLLLNLSGLEEDFDQLEPAEQRRVIEAVFESVTLLRRGAGNYRKQPAKVLLRPRGYDSLGAAMSALAELRQSQPKPTDLRPSRLAAARKAARNRPTEQETSS